MHSKGYVNFYAIILFSLFVGLAEREIAVVVLAEYLNGPFYGIGARMMTSALTFKSAFQSVSYQVWYRTLAKTQIDGLNTGITALIINACLEALTLEVVVGVEDV